MILRVLVIIVFGFLAGCDFFDSEGSKEPKSSKTSKIEATPGNCLKHCEPMQQACSDFAEKQAECEKTNEASSCLAVVKSFSAMSGMYLNNTFACKDSCWNVSHNNRLEICESSEDTNFKDLSKRFMDVVMSHPSPTIKALGSSERLLKLKNERFNERYYRLANKKSPFELPKVHMVQERSKGQKDFEIWLRRKDLDCLPSSLKSKIEKMRAKNPTSNVFDISSSYKAIATHCGLKNLKPFLNTESVDSNLSLKKIEYFTKAAESGDCSYPAPRIVVSFRGEKSPLFLAHKDFKVIEDHRFLSFLTSINDNRSFYYSLGSEFTGPFSFKGRKFVFTAMPSMATSYDLVEVTDNGLHQIPMQGLFQEPCGS